MKHPPLSSQGHPPLSSSIFRKHLSQALLLTGFVVVLLTTLTLFVTKSILEQAMLSQMSSVASTSEDAMEQALQLKRERASWLSTHTDIQSTLIRSTPSRILGRMFEQVRRDDLSLVGIELFSVNGVLLDSAGEFIGLPNDARLTPQYRTVMNAAGWHRYDVWTPVWNAAGSKMGYLALRYDVQPMLERFTANAPLLGANTHVFITRSGSGDVQLFHVSAQQNESYILSLGTLTNATTTVMPWLLSVEGSEGMTHSIDEAGRDILVAYRYLPTLGWGMAFIADRYAVLAGVRTLAYIHASIGTILLLLSAVLAWLLSRQLTEPLRSLTKRVLHLREGAWAITRQVHTGDEVEVLESGLVDMANRLQKLYRSQEREIRKRTKELHHQYALDRVILNTIEYGVCTVDRTGIITAINAAGLRLLCQKNENVLGLSVQDVLHLCGHRGEDLKGAHPVLQCIKTGHLKTTSMSARLSIRRKNDTLLPIFYTVSPLRDVSKVTGAVMVFQDVTDERKVDYLKSEFISLASHQLRTPLAALRWYTELLSDSGKSLGKDQREYVRQMKDSIERMNTLLSSLLRASRMDAQNLQPNIEKTNITDLIDKMYADFVPIAQEAGVKCQFLLPKNAIYLDTDPTLLRIILQNLLSNAIKYSAKNSQKLVVLELSETHTRVQVAVRDKGMGIPQNEQRRVFQKFFRAKNVRKMDTDGNGLGLYITRSIVERVRGKIQFTSIENKGTTFTVSFAKSVKKK